MTPFGARIKGPGRKPKTGYLHEYEVDAIIDEVCVVIELVLGPTGGLAVCVKGDGAIWTVPIGNLTAVVSPEWKALMAQVELSSTGEKQRDPVTG